MLLISSQVEETKVTYLVCKLVIDSSIYQQFDHVNK